LNASITEAVATAPVEDSCAECDEFRTRARVNTVAFDVLDEDGVVGVVDRFRRCGRAHAVHFLAAHPTVVAREAKSFRMLLQRADLVVADGAPIALAMRAQGYRTASRVTSTDAFLRVCRDGASRGVRHFFLGGSSEEVTRSLLAHLAEIAPGLEVVGYEIPPFRDYNPDEVAELADRVRKSSADVLWIGIGAPRQDILAHRLRSAQAAPVVACIGATFDFVAGSKTRAPAWLRAVGCEWLYRLAQEPRRLWRRYLIGNTKFILGAIAGLLSERLAATTRLRRGMLRR